MHSRLLNLVFLVFTCFSLRILLILKEKKRSLGRDSGLDRERFRGFSTGQGVCAKLLPLPYTAYQGEIPGKEK